MFVVDEFKFTIMLLNRAVPVKDGEFNPASPNDDVAVGEYIPLTRPTKTCPIVGFVAVPVPPLTGKVTAA